VPVADIRVSPQVKRLIGGEMVQQLHGPAYERYSCLACGLAGSTSQSTSVVALWYRNNAVAVKLARARCVGSQLIVVGDDLLPADLDIASQMRVIAAVLPYPGQVLLPVLACEPAEAFAAQITGDHVNVQVSALLGLGMTLLAAADQLPARVKRWRLHLPDRHTARLPGPGRAVVYDGDCEQPGDWAELIAGTDSCVVLIGVCKPAAPGIRQLGVSTP
jgi:hypothetical protein